MTTYTTDIPGPFLRITARLMVPEAIQDYILHKFDQQGGLIGHDPECQLVLQHAEGFVSSTHSLKCIFAIASTSDPICKFLNIDMPAPGLGPETATPSMRYAIHKMIETHGSTSISHSIDLPLSGTLISRSSAVSPQTVHRRLLQPITEFRTNQTNIATINQICFAILLSREQNKFCDTAN